MWLIGMTHAQETCIRNLHRIERIAARSIWCTFLVQVSSACVTSTMSVTCHSSVTWLKNFWQYNRYGFIDDKGYWRVLTAGSKWLNEYERLTATRRHLKLTLVVVHQTIGTTDCIVHLAIHNSNVVERINEVTLRPAGLVALLRWVISPCHLIKPPTAHQLSLASPPRTTSQNIITWSTRILFRRQFSSS